MSIADELDGWLISRGFQGVPVVGTERVYERAKPSGARVLVYTGLHRTFVPKRPKPIRVRISWVWSVVAVWTGAIVEPTDGWQDRLLDAMREAWWRAGNSRCPRCGWTLIVLDSHYEQLRSFLRCSRQGCGYQRQSGIRGEAPWRPRNLGLDTPKP